MAAFGQQGVERVLEIRDNELRLAMISCGTIRVRDIGTGSIIDKRRLQPSLCVPATDPLSDRNSLTRGRA